MDTYGFGDKDATLPLLRFGTDISFAIPARTFAQAWSNSGVSGASAYLFHFACPNPWDGPWKGQATHVLDISFALLNYEDQLAPGQRACGRKFADDLIGFVHEGVAPWEPYNQKQSTTSMRYFATSGSNSDESAVITDAALSSSGRMGYLYSLDADSLDRASEAWQGFMAGQ